MLAAELFAMEQEEKDNLNVLHFAWKCCTVKWHLQG